MKEMKNFEQPKFTVIRFENADVITTSEWYTVGETPQITTVKHDFDINV